MSSRRKSVGGEGCRVGFAVEGLEPRIVLTGYFAAGVAYDEMGPVLFNEFGEYDETTGEILAGSRSDTDTGFSGSPWSSFTLGDPSGQQLAGVTFEDGDPYASRVSVGIGTTPLGFSVGFGGLGYELPIDVSYIFNQPTDLGEGSGGRDGEYFFNGAVRDVTSGDWHFVHGPASIDGVSLTGHQTFEGGAEVPYAYSLDPSGIFRDGYTTFDGHSSIALFGDDLRSVLQTDLDGSDGFQSYSLGMRLDAGVDFSVADLAGDVFALSLTGSPLLASFFGETGGSSEAFSYTGALEFADGGTYRLYELRDYYTNGRADAGVLMSGSYTTDGDGVSLTSLDASRRLDLRLSGDLSLSLGVRYEYAGNEYNAFGGGPRIGDGNEGDFPAVDDDDGDDEPPIRYTFEDFTPAIGSGGTKYGIGRTTDGDDIRYNISDLFSVALRDDGFAVWTEENGRELEGIATSAVGVHYFSRSFEGVWTTGDITTDTNHIPVGRVGFDDVPGGGMSVGGFNAAGDLLRFDCADEVWTVTRLPGIAAPDGAAASPSGDGDLLITPWGGWHFLYTDTADQLRAAWTTPTLGTYYNNNLSLRAGLGSVDGNAVDASYTAGGQINIGLTHMHDLYNIWWRPGSGGMWMGTNFADVVGSVASGLSPDFIGTHVDFETGDLYNIGVLDDSSDVVMIQWRLGTGWDGFRVKADLSLSSYEVPDPTTIVLGGLTRDNAISVRGSVPGLGGVPIVSRLFTDRAAGDSDRDLLVYLTASLVEPMEE